ncbi:MAG: cysteine--tRNA ligase [bacterium]
MFLFNTLTRQKEEFRPLEPARVTLYSCGPTVYRDVHLGNLRTFLLADWLKRTLIFLGYKVFHVKNITDVGHMRQELLERGEDKLIAAARKAGMSSRQIADHYTKAFMEDEARLNILPADLFPRATDHIQECITLIERLLEKGHAYVVGGNVYFDVASFEAYGKLSGNLIQGLMEAVRVEADPYKRNPRDFTLWKAAEPGREMKWPSPWGEGFPGWHIECSAMSLKYLGERFDIHSGGVDNIFPHHEDELAQSEAAAGHKVVNYWVHGQHLLADGLKMAKSAGNDYTIRDVERLGFDPLAFRYLCLTVHYRSRLNFTFSALRSAQRGLSHIRRHAEDKAWQEAELPCQGPGLKWLEAFIDAIKDDLAMPRALAVVWAMLHDKKLTEALRARLLIHMDKVLGLGLESWPQLATAVPPEGLGQVELRDRLRSADLFEEADRIRQGLQMQGFEIRDLPGKTLLLRRSRAEWKGLPREISSSREVRSLLEEPDQYDFTVSLVAWNNSGEILRCYKALRQHCLGHRIQIIVVEGGSSDESREAILRALSSDPDAAVWLADHRLGEAASRNVALRQALGRIVVLMDPSLEPLGDVMSPLERTLQNPEVGLTGAAGLVTRDCQKFHDSPGPEVHAITLYCMAFPRRLVALAGWMDERFRFYRHLDLDYSFRIRQLGFKAIITPELPVRFHTHTIWESMDPQERYRRSRANFYLFYRKWHHHTQLFSPTS